MREVLHTKWGTARIDKSSYYRITSYKEGNRGRFLHRLIFEDYHGCVLDENDVIHHIDGDTLNNHPTNLICMSKKAHQLLHHRGKKRSVKTINKMRERKIGVPQTDECMLNNSKSKSTTGLFRVTKVKSRTTNQGFKWVYQYYNKDKKRKQISRVSLLKLKEAVLKKRLKWNIVDVNKARSTCKEYSYNFKEFEA